MGSGSEWLFIVMVAGREKTAPDVNLDHVSVATGTDTRGSAADAVLVGDPTPADAPFLFVGLSGGGFPHNCSANTVWGTWSTLSTVASRAVLACGALLDSNISCEETPSVSFFKLKLHTHSST
jgi:hypothetical protein